MPKLDEHLAHGLGLYELFDRIKAVTQKDLKHKTIQDLFLSASEELGEVAEQIKVECGVFGNAHKEVKEGIAVDLALCAVALCYSTGWSVQQIIDYAHQKLDKWEKSQERSEKALTS